jgi:hypothetical protein
MLHGMAMFFLTAVAGYWVLERAESHKEGMLRRLGRVLGIIIILLSFIAIGTSGAYAKRHYRMMKGPGMHGYGQPMYGHRPTPPPEPGMLGD